MPKTMFIGLVMLVSLMAPPAFAAAPMGPPAAAVDYFSTQSQVYWQQRTGRAVCRPNVTWARLPGPVAAVAEIGGCDVWLNDLYDLSFRRDWELLCGTIWHELGHLAGLGHDPRDPVMRPAGPEWGTCPWIRGRRR